VATVTERLENLKRQIEQGKSEKVRAETNLEALEKQRKEIEAELAELASSLTIWTRRSKSCG